MPHLVLILLPLPLLALAISAFGTRGLIHFLTARNILDRPNARSNHTAPTPRGGGLAIIAAILICSTLAIFLYPNLNRPIAFPGITAIALGTMLLTFTGWRDDRGGLSAPLRLTLQFVAALLGMMALPDLVFQGFLPSWIDRPLTLLIWVWWINAFNFMDGIDGIAGSQTLHLALGLFIVTVAGDFDDSYMLHIMILGAAAFGFLIWNWHPARIFLGDAGSLPLGYLTGFLLLQAAAQNAFASALLLPAYYITDAGITLATRILRRERFWEAHSQHAYQRAARRGHNHAEITRTIIALNTVLLLLTLAIQFSLVPWWAALGCGYALSLWLYLHLRGTS